jgi:hypothetical protein
MRALIRILLFGFFLHEVTRGGVPQGLREYARSFAKCIQGADTDTAGGHIDHALEGAVVVAIVEQAKVGQGILDLRALVKAQSAVNAIGQRSRQFRFSRTSPRARRKCESCERARNFPYTGAWNTGPHPYVH